MSPYEIHHSKSNLVNNELLCKITTFYEINQFILSGYSKYYIHDGLLEGLFEDHKETIKNDKFPQEFFENLEQRKNTFWDHKSTTKKKKKSYMPIKTKGKNIAFSFFNNCALTENLGLNSFKTQGTNAKIDEQKLKWIENYLNDFEPNFTYSQDYKQYDKIVKQIHKRYYEAPKLISDVLEAILGAIFVDGGYNEVVRVLQHLIGPLVIMVAKFFDKIRKNPIEEFNWFWLNSRQKSKRGRRDGTYLNRRWMSST